MNKEPKYRVLANLLRESIQKGIYPGGCLLKTENELAKEYDISRQTVRQALDVLVSDGLIERRKGSGTYVRQRKQRREKTMTIGVIANHISEYIFPAIIRGIESELSLNGYKMELSVTCDSIINERKILNEYLKKPIDGLIIEGVKTNLPNPNIQVYKQLSDIGVPYIFFNEYYHELEEAAYVITDDYTASKKAVQYLVKKGHKCIAGLFNMETLTGVKRYHGYLEGLLEENIDVNEKHIIWFTIDKPESIFEGESGSFLLKSLEGCTAIVCATDVMAVMLYDLLRKLNKRVPEDMAIVSFDNSIFSNLCSVKLTSMNHPKEELGLIVVKQLIKMIDGRNPEHIILPMDMVEKQST